jgi:hypothetical protein
MLGFRNGTVRDDWSYIRTSGGTANITFITCLMYLCSNIIISMYLICHNILCLLPTHWPGRPVQYATDNAWWKHATCDWINTRPSVNHYFQHNEAATLISWLACWSLVPKIVGSNPAEAFGFFGRKILSMPYFGGEVNPSVPCRRFSACKRNLRFTLKLESAGKIDRLFLAQFHPSLTEVSHVAWRGAPLDMTDGTIGGAQRASCFSRS